MKNTILLLVVTLFTGCSGPKSIKPTASCFEYQQEMEELRSKQRDHTVQNVTAFVIGANFAHQEDKRIDEKIRVLEMKLTECKR